MTTVSKTSMTSRERLQALLDLAAPDRVPWAPLFEDSYLPSQPRYWSQLTPDQQRTLQRTYRYPSVVPLPMELDFAEAAVWQMIGDLGGDVIASDPADLQYDLADEPERMKALFELLHERALQGYRLLAQAPGRAVWLGMAYMTTQLISPRQFGQFVLPYLAEYVRILHEGGKLVLCHMCGHISRLLPMLREAGVDGVECMATPPLGDTDLENYWQAMGDHAILITGINAPELLATGPGQLRSQVRSLLRRTEGRHFILRTADEVPLGTPWENLLAIGKVIRETG